MNADLKIFWIQWARVAVVALVPVLLVAFTTIPYSLGGHPGELATRTTLSDGHLT